eukprot:6470443-Amphidinium_carterae.2
MGVETQTCMDTERSQSNCSDCLVGMSSSDLVLHLFSGPSDRRDSFAAGMRRMGYPTAENIIANGDHQDLANDLVWANCVNWRQKLHSIVTDAELRSICLSARFSTAVRHRENVLCEDDLLPRDGHHVFGCTLRGLDSL